MKFLLPIFFKSNFEIINTLSRWVQILFLLSKLVKVKNVKNTQKVTRTSKTEMQNLIANKELEQKLELLI